jgi:predicted translin family RNA/ssDNA-binding protein
MENRNQKLILIGLLLLFLFSIGGNVWQNAINRKHETTIDSLLTQESGLREILWKNKYEIDLLQGTKDSLINLLALSLEKNAMDSLKIQRLLLDIAQLNRQVDSLQKVAFSGVDPRYRKYYEDRIAAESQKLAMERANSDSLQAKLNRQYSFSRKLSSDLNQIQDYFDELSGSNLITEYVQFDAKGRPINIVQNAIDKVKQLQNELEKNKRLLETYENESWAKSMKSQLSNYQKTIEELKSKIREYEKILNTALVASGNSEFLSKNQLLTTTKGRLLKPSNRDFHPENLKDGQPACYSVDIREPRFMIKASGDIVELFPNRALSSYRISSNTGDPNRKEITVINPSVFWAQKTLIVLTK